CRSPTAPGEELRQALLPGGRQDRVHGVVDGDDALEMAVVIDHGDGQQVVAGDDLGDLVLVVEDADGNGLLDHDLGDRHVRLRDNEVPKGKHADEPLVGIDDVDVVDRL